MASKFQQLYLDAMERIKVLERVRDSAADGALLSAALRVINRNSLTDEFVQELLMRPRPTIPGAGG